MKYLAAFVIGLLVVPLGVYFYFTSGLAPVATTDSDMPFEHALAAKALDARVQRDMPKIVPIPANENNYLAGADLYRQHCAVCHGLPLTPRTAIASGMYPRPPLLLEGKGVTDDEPGESYWKISNGIRLTGMPGFAKSLNETQMWQIALLVANADKLPPSARALLVAPLNPPVPAPGNGAPALPATTAPIPAPPTK
jgi:thiosulfate dehydrogenase